MITQSIAAERTRIALWREAYTLKADTPENCETIRLWFKLGYRVELNSPALPGLGWSVDGAQGTDIGNYLNFLYRVCHADRI